MSDFAAFLKQAANVKPSRRQLDWFEKNFYAFVHFSPNTYTGLEWGTGKEDPAVFNPTELDCDQWVEAIKSAGMKGMVLTAKHHDGFCLWPSAHTRHSVKNSPWKGGKGDVVREASEACRRGGIAFGFYLSPWDRNCAFYGTNEYNDYYKKQLTELLTGYGDIFIVWFDGACGEGPNGKKQVYDYQGYIQLIRKYQPGAAIFNDGGPDVRWIGNESGRSRYAEWAVVPGEMARLGGDVQTGPGPIRGDLSEMYNTDEAIGCLSNIVYSKGLCFLGAEINMSIRPGWFYHPEEAPHSLERLFDTYCRSVGGNACFHLNVPPMPNGRFDPRDVERLKELGDLIRQTFGTNLIKDAEITREDAKTGDTQCVYYIRLKKKIRITYVALRENIALGQKVENFLVQVPGEEMWHTLYNGTTIGNRKYCLLEHPVETDCLRIKITSARDRVDLYEISAY